VESPLIFKLSDESLWQLCDVGLGPTRFDRVKPNWTEHPALKPYLPADILLRSQVVAPWQYEFNLAKNAVVWVKPGPQARDLQVGHPKTETAPVRLVRNGAAL
jgi:hypothetical protein